MTRPTSSRADDIRWELDLLKARGIVTDYYSYAPGDRYGRRWVIWGPSLSRTFYTREMEVFIEGTRAIAEEGSHAAR